MFLCIKCRFFLTANIFVYFMLCFKIRVAADSLESSEDDKLREALILVDMLKSEYLKVANENAYLRNKNVKVSDVEEDESTCAMTSRNDGVNARNHENITTVSALSSKIPTTTEQGQSTDSQPALPKITPPGTTTATPILAPLTLQPTQFDITGIYPPPINVLSPHYFRRQMPRSYYNYYYDVPEPYRRNRFNVPLWYNRRNNNYRRTELQSSNLKGSNYDDYVGLNPKSTSSPAEVEMSTSTAVRRSGNFRKPATSTIGHKSDPHTSRKRQKLKGVTQGTRNASAASGNITTTTSRVVSSDAPASTVTAKNKWKSLLKETAETKDPVMSQIASEFVDELQNYRITPKGLSLNKEKQITYKTSLKIFLEGSTKLMFPLPVNNRFCFTNPRSALCRTFI